MVNEYATHIMEYLEQLPLGIEGSVLLIIPFILLSLFFKWLFRCKVYLFDAKKYAISMRLTNMLLLLIYLGVVFSNGSPQWSSFLEIVVIISLAKLIYHVISSVITRYYGVEKEREHEVKNPIRLYLLQERLKRNEEEPEGRVDLGDGYYYLSKGEKFYRRLKVYEASKVTAFVDIMLVVGLTLFAFVLILPILKSVSMLFDNDYVFGFFAFLGAYVFSPAFPDLYALYKFIRNRRIDLGKFIAFMDEGRYVKGRIIQMSGSDVVLKDHVTGMTRTVPNSLLGSKVLDNLSDIQNDLGRKAVLQYVVGLDAFEKDLGLKLRTVFKLALDAFQNESKSISRQDEYNVWLSSDDNGVKITLWYFITHIETEEKIMLDIEDFMLREATCYGFDLRTPTLHEIVASPAR